MIVPRARSPICFVLVAVWLFVWASVIVAPSESPAFSDGTLPAGPRPSLWLLLSAGIGALLTIGMLWQLASREILMARDVSLSIRREIFGIGRTFEYAAEHVRDFRAVAMPLPFITWGRSNVPWGFGQGTLALDYGARTIRFGAGVDEAEARVIAEAVIRRFPRYSPKGNPFRAD